MTSGEIGGSSAAIFSRFSASLSAVAWSAMISQSAKTSFPAIW